MEAAAIVSVVLRIVETIGPWLVKLFMLVAVYVFLRSFQTNRVHNAVHKAVETAHHALMAIYADLKPLSRPLLEVYALIAAGNGVVFPDWTDPNIHVLYRMLFRPRAPQLVPVVTGVPNAAQPVPRPQSLKVTNNSSATLQLTCKESVLFEHFLKQGQTLTLPDNIKSPATVVVQGYLEDFKTVMLVHRIDFHQVQHVSIKDMNGSIQMVPCDA